jgi:hypothetical protein
VKDLELTEQSAKETLDQSPRIQKFRKSLIEVLPSMPNDRASRASLAALPTIRLILSYITWRMRHIPAKPRTVKRWLGGVSLVRLYASRGELSSLLKDVSEGNDLTPYLSTHVAKAGIVLQGASPQNRRRDIDTVLVRHGLHHFHVGYRSKENPKGRSGTLLFADVQPHEFRIIAISNHDAFTLSSVEQKRLMRICESYISRELPAGAAYMTNPVLASGHSFMAWAFARKCVDEMERLDAMLESETFVDSLYSLSTPHMERRPHSCEASDLEWGFHDLRFGILDKKRGYSSP